MPEIDKILKLLLEFRDKRDWDQFHDSKNLALAISIEASELNELFLWKNTSTEIEDINKEQLADELADVLSYSFLLAEKNGLDISTIIENKILKNKEKYPIEKARGSSKKYDEL